VVFTAAPASGQRLLSWTGCTTSNTSTCTVLLNQASGAKAVSAAFGPLPAASISVGPGGQRSFGPHTVTISAGQTVEWTWESNNHNVVSGDPTTGTADGQFCSPGDVNCASTLLSNTPTVYTHTFTTPGTYNYFCRAHRILGMVGTVVVNPAE
jgi:plastocyanin